MKTPPRPPRRRDVAAICVSALGESPVAIRPIVGDGLVNAVFEVRAASRQLIVRIELDEPSSGAFRKERWCMARAREAGVPGAEVVALGTHGAYRYAIHTKLPGVIGTRWRGDLDRVWRQVGRYARRFHTVEAEGFGEHLGGPVGTSPDTTLAGWVDFWDAYTFDTDRLVDAGVLPARSFDATRAAVSQIRDWPGEPGLCHGNLSLANVLVDGSDVFIIDWGTAAGHLTPLFDLAELHVWSTDPAPPGLRAFLVGYGLSAVEHDAMRARLDVLQLWRVLSSARWMLETGRGRPAAKGFLAEKARLLIETLGIQNPA